MKDDPAELISRINKATDTIKKSGETVAAQHKLINDLLTVLESGAAPDISRTLADLESAVMSNKF